jgi:hypothetical protein
LSLDGDVAKIVSHHRFHVAVIFGEKKQYQYQFRGCALYKGACYSAEIVVFCHQYWTQSAQYFSASLSVSNHAPPLSHLAGGVVGPMGTLSQQQTVTQQQQYHQYQQQQQQHVDDGTLHIDTSHRMLAPGQARSPGRYGI